MLLVMCNDFKGCIAVTYVIFLTYQTVLLVLKLAFIHLVFVSTLLNIIDQKMNWVNMFLKYK